MSDPRDSDDLYPPEALAEVVDLPLDAKKEILRLCAQLGRGTHWEVLGVPWNAPVAAVHAAYVEKVKRFHPDRYAGRKLGSYLGRIEKIFRALTVARDELTDEAHRAEYARRTAPPPAREAAAEADRAVSKARAQERRQRFARTDPMMARVARVHALLARGKQEMEAGQFGKAVNDFATVLGLDPNHLEARELAEQARRRAGAERAQALHESALAAEAVGSHTRAIAILKQAADANPHDPRHALAAARIALERGETGTARELAEQAARGAPRDAHALELLGVILEAQGEHREARKVLERALAVDPNLATAKALAKKLRWKLF